MPETMTPREKVARIVDPAAFLFTTDELVKGDTSQYDALDKADAILTALASGSGDHAELARWAKDWPYYSCTSEVIEAIIALLAENAALLDYGKSAAKEALEYRDRATEAERKLAEAVGLKHLKDDQIFAAINAAVTITKDRNGVDNGAVCISPVKFRTFLSKEAERG